MILKATGQIDLMDKRLLEKAQDEFPLTIRPWASIGNELGITEREAMERLSELFRKGVIRKIGPTLDANRVGLRVSTLIAMKVPENRIQNVANMISKYQGVSHCYEREHEYNLWFTIAAQDESELKQMLQEIRLQANVAKDDMLDLQPTRIFKIDVRFQLT
jgi:DNA-binding Lrp family transcriptional regulator